MCAPGWSGMCLAKARRYRNSGLEGVGAAEAQMSQRADGIVRHDTAMIENLLEFGGCRRTFPRCHVRPATQVSGIEAGVNPGS